MKRKRYGIGFKEINIYQNIFYGKFEMMLKRIVTKC